MSEQQDPPVHLVHTHDIVERSDFDRDQKVRAGEVGEDWGDGFFVNEEPVMVLRGPDGGIVKTVPLSEAQEAMQEAAEVDPVVADTVITPTPISRADRDKLVEILAIRLFKWYAAQPRRPDKYNPVYDGIPDAPPGSPLNLQPPPGMNLFPATPGQVLEWLKMTVIAPRVRIQNNKRGLDGYRPSLSIVRDV